MINYEYRSYSDHFRMLCTIKGSVYRHIALISLLYAGWGLAVSFMAKRFGDSTDKGIGFTATTHTVISPAISFILVYRVQLAYGRYWEARVLLGNLTASAREFCHHVWTNMDYKRGNKDSFGLRVNLIRLAMALCRYNNAYLRAGGKHDGAKDSFSYLRDFLLDEERESLKESAMPRTSVLGGYIREAIARAEDQGVLKQPHIQLAIQGLNAMLANITGMHRIMATPVPIPFTQVLEVGLFIFTATLPFVFVPLWKSEKEPYATPVIMFFFAFIMYGLKNLSYEIEDPFGDDDNDLPLPECQAEVESDMRDMLRSERARLNPAVRVMNEEECACVLMAMDDCDCGTEGLAMVSFLARKDHATIAKPISILAKPITAVAKLAGMGARSSSEGGIAKGEPAPSLSAAAGSALAANAGGRSGAPPVDLSSIVFTPAAAPNAAGPAVLELDSQRHGEGASGGAAPAGGAGHPKRL